MRFRHRLEASSRIELAQICQTDKQYSGVCAADVAATDTCRTKLALPRFAKPMLEVAEANADAGAGAVVSAKAQAGGARAVAQQAGDGPEAMLARFELKAGVARSDVGAVQPRDLWCPRSPDLIPGRRRALLTPPRSREARFQSVSNWRRRSRRARGGRRRRY